MSDQTQNTDSRSFEQLLPLYCNVLKNFAMKYTSNTDDAKDLMQDTLLKALQYRNHFQHGTNLKAWLFTIMRNTFINGYRRKSLRQMISGSPMDELDENHSTCDSSRSAEHKFTREDIAEAFKHVAQPNLMAFTRYIEGYKYHEIAIEQQIAIGTVKSRIHAARKILMQQLPAYHETYPRSHHGE